MGVDLTKKQININCAFRGRLSHTVCDQQRVVDDIEGERFHLPLVLLAICKVNISPLDVQ